MPAVERNWNYYDYVSDDGNTYSLRASEEWVALGTSGLVLADGSNPRLIASKTQRPRRFIYRDPTTFRTISGPVADAATYTTEAIGSAVSVSVPGLATAVTYNLVKKVPERVPTTIVGPGLGDHA